MEILEKVQKLKAELDSLRPLDPEREARVWQKLRLDWNYHSNKLEGNTYSYGETKMLLMKGLTAGGKPVRDHEEITGHNEAISFVLESIKDGEQLTEAFIRHLHTLTLVRDFWSEAKTSEGQPTKRLIKVGVYKSEPNHVETQSGEIFRFAEPIETPAMMEELVSWYREKESERDTNAILLASEFHYRFVRIHPFDDGNGRLARLLMNFVLMKYGFPPVIIKNEDKDNYIAVLEQADFAILAPFVNYIAENLTLSLDLMIRGAKGEDIEEPEDLEKELALIKREVRGLGRIVEVRRSRDAVLNVFEKSVVPLALKFFEEFRSFDELYVENHAYLFINEQVVLGEYDNAPHYARREFEKTSGDSISVIKVSYVNIGFTQLSFGNFQYQADISTNFELTKFTVTSRMTGHSLEKLYSEILTSEEISDFIRIEKRRHLEIIKDKLKETKKKA